MSYQINDFETALGHYINVFSAMEAVLAVELEAMASLEANLYLKAAISRLSYRDKVDLFRAYATLMGGDSTEHSTEIKAIYKDLVRIGEERNRVVHDAKLLHLGSPIRAEAIVRKAFEIKYVAINTSDLLRIADEILKHATRFQDLRRKLSPDK